MKKSCKNKQFFSKARQSKNMSVNCSFKRNLIPKTIIYIFIATYQLWVIFSIAGKWGRGVRTLNFISPTLLWTVCDLFLPFAVLDYSLSACLSVSLHPLHTRQTPRNIHIRLSAFKFSGLAINNIIRTSHEINNQTDQSDHEEDTHQSDHEVKI